MKNYQKYTDESMLTVTIFTLSKSFTNSLYTNQHLSYVIFIKKLKTTEMLLEIICSKSNCFPQMKDILNNLSEAKWLPRQFQVRQKSSCMLSVI